MLKVVFLHPDLGIGGAERLVIDAALALKSKGHYVNFVTTHHDSSHCFKETKDGTFDVMVVGDWLPRNFFGRFFAFFAYLRMIYAACWVIFFSGLKPDIVFCDLVSVCIPILRLSRKVRILFYCHFPDQLLSKPEGPLKKIYRMPLNWLEEITTGMSHRILVNSNFTSTVFEKTFKKLAKKIKPSVLYPCVDLSRFQPLKNVSNRDLFKELCIPDDSILLLSINRYERKKNLKLALDTLKELTKGLIPKDICQRVHLVMAGGYDSRVNENVEHYKELVSHCDAIGMAEKVTFLKSPSDAMKVGLLQSSSCLLYTPSEEHFGIVPIEAMGAGCPVVAVCSGGPMETVIDQQTGFLCEPLPESFAEAVAKLFKNKDLIQTMGEKGRVHVKTFSNQAFADSLENVIQDLLRGPGNKRD